MNDSIELHNEEIKRDFLATLIRCFVYRIMELFNISYLWTKQYLEINPTKMNDCATQLQYTSIKLPYELVNIILEYDGRIKYKYKQPNSIDYHKYVNIIHKNDERFNIITPIIHKKKQIMTDTDTSPVDTSFYFEFAFDNQPMLGLCYDYNWSFDNQFEICYTDMKGSGHIIGSDQIRHICA